MNDFLLKLYDKAQNSNVSNNERLETRLWRQTRSWSIYDFIDTSMFVKQMCSLVT